MSNDERRNTNYELRSYLAERCIQYPAQPINAHIADIASSTNEAIARSSFCFACHTTIGEKTPARPLNTKPTPVNLGVAVSPNLNIPTPNNIAATPATRPYNVNGSKFHPRASGKSRAKK